MTKTISARIPERLHEEIINCCTKEGWIINEFLNGAIELAIIGHTNFEFGEPEDDRLGAIEYERQRRLGLTQ